MTVTRLRRAVTYNIPAEYIATEVYDGVSTVVEKVRKQFLTLAAVALVASNQFRLLKLRVSVSFGASRWSSCKCVDAWCTELWVSFIIRSRREDMTNSDRQGIVRVSLRE